MTYSTLILYLNSILVYVYVLFVYLFFTRHFMHQKWRTSLSLTPESVSLALPQAAGVSRAGESSFLIPEIFC